MNNTKAVLPSYPTYPSLEPIIGEVQTQSFPENRSVENPKEALTQNRAEEHHQEVSFGEAFQKIESHAEKCASAESLIESYEAANFDQKLGILNKLFSILIEDINNYGPTSETPQKPDIVASLKWFCRFFNTPTLYNSPNDFKANLVINFLPKLLDLWLHHNYSMAIDNITQLLSSALFLVDKSFVETFNHAKFFDDLAIKLNQYASTQLLDNPDKVYFISIILSYFSAILTVSKGKLFISKDNLQQLSESICLLRQRLEKISANKTVETLRLLENETELKKLI